MAPATCRETEMPMFRKISASPTSLHTRPGRALLVGLATAGSLTASLALAPSAVAAPQPDVTGSMSKTFYVVNDTYKYTAKVDTWTNPYNVNPLWVPPSTPRNSVLHMGAFHTWDLNFDYGYNESVVTYELDDASGHFVNVIDIDMKTSSANQGSASCATSTDVKCDISWDEHNSVVIDLRTNSIP
jgi:hypothetical protein